MTDIEKQTDEEVVLGKEVFRVMQEWSDLGFADASFLKEVWNNDIASLKGKEYGYINIQEKEVIYGGVLVFDHPENENDQGLFLNLNDNCKTEQYSDQQDEEGRYYRFHATFVQTVCFFHTDIEFLESIKNKYIQVFEEALEAMTNNWAPHGSYRFIVHLLGDMLVYIKKLNRRNKA